MSMAVGIKCLFKLLTFNNCHFYESIKGTIMIFLSEIKNLLAYKEDRGIGLCE